MAKRMIAVWLILAVALVLVLANAEHIHEWQEATCTEAKTCKVCGATEGEPRGHMPAEVFPQMDPTCTHDGFTDKWVCTVCGEVTKESVPIPATGHEFVNWISDGEKAHTATCVHSMCRAAKTTDCVLCGFPEGYTEAAGIVFCPVCGYCEGGAEAEAVREIEVEGEKPEAHLCAHVLKVNEEQQYLVLSFEKDGETVPVNGEFKLLLPEEMKETSFAMIGGDGTEMPLESVMEEDEAFLSIPFVTEETANVVVLLRMN